MLRLTACAQAAFLSVYHRKPTPPHRAAAAMPGSFLGRRRGGGRLNLRADPELEAHLRIGGFLSEPIGADAAAPSLTLRRAFKGDPDGGPLAGRFGDGPAAAALKLAAVEGDYVLRRALGEEVPPGISGARRSR